MEDADRDPDQLQARVRELTEQLQSARGRVAGLIDSVMDAVITLDSGQRVSLFNPAAERMFGYTAGEIIGQPVEILMPSRFRRSHSDHVRDFGTSGATTRRMGSLGQVTGRRRDGTEFPIEASISHSEVGGERHFTAILRDISERLAQEEETELHLVRLKLLSEITKSIAGRQDLASVCQVVLRFLCDQFNSDFGVFLAVVRPGEARLMANAVSRLPLALAVLEMKPEAVLPITGGGLARCMAGEVIYEPDAAAGEGPLLDQLASAGLRSVAAIPLRGGEDVLGALVVARAGRRAYSTGEMDFLSQLCEHVALAARQLKLLEELQRAYEDIRTSQRTVMKQERLRAMGQMASGIAHDINNALGPITLYSEALLDTEKNLSERAHRYLKAIVTSSDAIAKTVASLRQFYRKREESLILQPVDLNGLLRQVVEITRPRWRDMPQEKGISISVGFDLDEALPEIMGSESEIRDAFINLVFNAIDAMPKGGTVTMLSRLTSSSISLEVVDTGIGMDTATRARCLEPFFTTKGERGTGLGLSMVFGMVQRHEGELEVDTQLGHGTTVRIILPVGRSAGPRESDAVSRRPRRALRVLCIDDDHHILESLVDTLGLDGHHVETADGGVEGIEALRAAMASGAPFDVVISDVGMPHMDGRAVAARIKELSPTTPVVLLTGWGDQFKEEELRLEDVDHVLSKPPRMKELREALALVCG